MAFCFKCREKNGTLEDGDGTRLYFHHHPVSGNGEHRLDDNTKLDTYIPNYVQVQACIEALQIYKKKEKENLNCQESFIGHKLLRYRCENQLNNRNIPWKTMYNNVLMWKKSFKAAEYRHPKLTGGYKRKKRCPSKNTAQDVSETHTDEQPIKKHRGHNLENERKRKVSKTINKLPLQESRTCENSIKESDQRQ